MDGLGIQKTDGWFVGKSHFSFIKLEVVVVVVFPSNGRSHFLFLFVLGDQIYIRQTVSQQKQQFFPVKWQKEVLLSSFFGTKPKPQEKHGYFSNGVKEDDGR